MHTVQWLQDELSETRVRLNNQRHDSMDRDLIVQSLRVKNKDLNQNVLTYIGNLAKIEFELINHKEAVESLRKIHSTDALRQLGLLEYAHFNPDTLSNTYSDQRFYLVAAQLKKVVNEHLILVDKFIINKGSEDTRSNVDQI